MIMKMMWLVLIFGDFIILFKKFIFFLIFQDTVFNFVAILWQKYQYFGRSAAVFPLLPKEDVESSPTVVTSPGKRREEEVPKKSTSGVIIPGLIGPCCQSKPQGGLVSVTTSSSHELCLFHVGPLVQLSCPPTSCPRVLDHLHGHSVILFVTIPFVLNCKSFLLFQIYSCCYSSRYALCLDVQ